MRAVFFKLVCLSFGIFPFLSCKQNNSIEKKHQKEFTPRKQAIEELDSLKLVLKFSPTVNYMGLQPSTNISRANSTLNKSIDRLIIILTNKPTTDEILSEFEVGLSLFNQLAIDTEDRERVCIYYDEIREIIGFNSTNNLLNNWLY